MYLRNEDGRLVVRVADFYDEYLNTIRKNMGPTHFMCLVLIDSVDNFVDIYERREDQGMQLLNLWLGEERVFTKYEESRMNASGIHSFVTEMKYIELAWLGMSEFQGTEHWMSEPEFNDYIENVGKAYTVFGLDNKDVKFTKLKNFMRVGMLKEIMQNNPGAKIYLT
jgi:hypothetical protein